MLWSILWFLLIVLAFAGASILILALTFGKAKIPYGTTGGTPGAPRTTPATPTSRIPTWVKSGKVWGGLAFLVVLNGAVWFFHHYASQYITVYSPWALFLAINVVIGLWATAILGGAKGWAKFGLFILSWFLIGAGLGFYRQSPAEFKAQLAANETRAESILPRSGEKVIVAPVGEWSELFRFPDGAKWIIDEGGNKAQARNGLGEEFSLNRSQDIENLGMVSGDPRKKMFQVSSREDRPVPVIFIWWDK